MSLEMPALPPTKCIAPDCPVMMPADKGVACEEHQDIAAELIAELNAGVPYVEET